MTPAPANIRRYAEPDWDALRTLHDAARLDELKLSVGANAFRPLADIVDDEGLFEGEVWVAEEADQMLGFVAIEGAEVSWLYVDPAYYRRGIGTSLLRHALGRIEGEAFTTVLEGNEPALHLYLRQGFEIVETKSGHLSGAPTIPARGHVLRRGDAAKCESQVRY